MAPLTRKKAGCNAYTAHGRMVDSIPMADSRPVITERRRASRSPHRLPFLRLPHADSAADQKAEHFATLPQEPCRTSATGTRDKAPRVPCINGLIPLSSRAVRLGGHDAHASRYDGCRPGGGSGRAIARVAGKVARSLTSKTRTLASNLRMKALKLIANTDTSERPCEVIRREWHHLSNYQCR